MKYAELLEHLQKLNAEELQQDVIAVSDNTSFETVIFFQAAEDWISDDAEDCAPRSTYSEEDAEDLNVWIPEGTIRLELE